jgi:nucleoid-associated protein YgaU
MFKSFRTVFAVAVLTVATYAAAAEMSGSHPDTYVVKRGDTLWDISARFLKKPWLWPEIWQANPQIKNPHLIYPGDVISLAYLDRVAVQEGPREEAPLNAIPLSDIEPFLKNLRVTDSFEHLPYVVALEEDRLRSVSGQAVYVYGLTDGQPGQRYSIVRPTVRYAANPRNDDLDERGRTTAGDSDMWRDMVPQTGSSEFLGYELKQVALGTVVRGVMPGTESSTLAVDAGGHEVRPGDRLIPVEAQPYDLHFFPHPPAAQVEDKLRVLAVADALTSGGPRDVVAISGGTREGLDNGTVLSVWRKGNHTAHRMKYPNSSRISEAPKSGAGRVALPDEYAAHIMIFRTFDKVSYGLVMEGVKPAKVGYALKHPDATY